MFVKVNNFYGIFIKDDNHTFLTLCVCACVCVTHKQVQRPSVL